MSIRFDSFPARRRGGPGRHHRVRCRRSEDQLRFQQARFFDQGLLYDRAASTAFNGTHPAPGRERAAQSLPLLEPTTSPAPSDPSGQTSPPFLDAARGFLPTTMSSPLPSPLPLLLLFDRYF